MMTTDRQTVPKGWIAIVAALLTIGSVLAGIGIAFGSLGERVKDGEEACRIARANEKAIVAIQKDTERLPRIEDKLDHLLRKAP